MEVYEYFYRQKQYPQYHMCNIDKLEGKYVFISGMTFYPVKYIPLHLFYIMPTIIDDVTLAVTIYSIEITVSLLCSMCLI